MKKELHYAKDRGTGDHQWLKSKFSFSFADYYNPDRMGFGLLRVLNDDIIAPGHGFPSHPHRDMEIITVVTEGELAHADNTGKKTVMKPGDIQVMSAGSGIIHSEFNNSDSADVKLFQLWIQTKEHGIKPRHDEKTFEFKDNEFNLVVSGKKVDNTLYIHQDAKISLGKFNSEKTVSYELESGNGAFVFVIEGSVEVVDEKLGKRDAIGISETEKIELGINEDSYVMVVEVPM